MLYRLYIKNLVLVETCEILFHKGFTVITGETGAGKSVILSSLNLLLGHRQDSSMIRQGASSSIIEATFIEPKVLPLLDESGISYDESHEIIIRRELLASGKSRAFVNDQTVQLTFLKQLAPYLVEVSAQHAHIELAQAHVPADIFDSFAENEPSKKAFQEAHQQHMSLIKKKQDFCQEEQMRIRRIETLEREIEEIATVMPVEGEDDALFTKYTELSKTSESLSLMQDLAGALDGEEQSALSQLARSKTLLERLAQKNSHYESYVAGFKGAFSEIQDLAFELAKSVESASDVENELQEIDFRLKKLHELKKKYGPTLTDVIAYKEMQLKSLSSLSKETVTIEELDEQLAAIKALVDKQAKTLSERRHKAKEHFSSAITKELSELNMPTAQFEVELTPHERTLDGDEQIQFFLTPNRGEQKVLVHEAASGGELARLSLAIKCVMMDKNPVGTILFDEIDANIGGETASLVGKKLAHVGKSCQVLAVTHFAQVAVTADHHLHIQKQEVDGRTTTHIKALEKEAERHSELNRMLGGNTSIAFFAASQ